MTDAGGIRSLGFCSTLVVNHVVIHRHPVGNNSSSSGSSCGGLQPPKDIRLPLSSEKTTGLPLSVAQTLGPKLVAFCGTGHSALSLLRTSLAAYRRVAITWAIGHCVLFSLGHAGLYNNTCKYPVPDCLICKFSQNEPRCARFVVVHPVHSFYSRMKRWFLLCGWYLLLALYLAFGHRMQFLCLFKMRKLSPNERLTDCSRC